MNRNKRIALYAGMAVSFAAVLVFSLPAVVLSKDETLDLLLTGVLSQAGLTGLALCLILFLGRRDLLSCNLGTLPRALLWSLPCLLTALANFPFFALASGAAHVSRTELIPLFALYCLLVGISEELLFRAVAHRYIREKLARKRGGYPLAVFLSSAFFGLWHLLNLIGGAGVGATLLQVGYTFLIGGMLAVTLDQTGNVWLCAFLHALFDTGGMLVAFLGYGEIHDRAFWIATAVCGALCCLHIVAAIVRTERRAQRDNAQSPPRA